MKVLITTIPFGQIDSKPLDLLNKNKIKYVINPLGKKLTETDLLNIISDFDAIIAGTEKISQKVIDKAKNLKFISRVGIGLDNIDLIATKNKNIKISYTPDAPSPAVAELTIGLMFSLLRSTHLSNSELHLKGKWKRFYGRRLSETKIGIIGVGRIGRKVLDHLNCLCKKKILVNDVNRDDHLIEKYNIEWQTKDEILKNSDLITIHLPLTPQTKDMFKKEELLLMKNDAMIINTSRGGIINENDLYNVMKSGHLSGAALDVFVNEPYNGNLREIERCILTPHIGPMSVDCRTRMEIEATEEVIRFFKGKELKSIVPLEEYIIQNQIF